MRRRGSEGGARRRGGKKGAGEAELPGLFSAQVAEALRQSLSERATGAELPGSDAPAITLDLPPGTDAAAVEKVSAGAAPAGRLISPLEPDAVVARHSDVETAARERGCVSLDIGMSSYATAAEPVGSDRIAPEAPPLETSPAARETETAAAVENRAGNAAFATEPLPARMLNEFVYCPRLFYYEHVEGVFVDNADTLRGAAIHARVDVGSGALPAAEVKTATATKPVQAYGTDGDAAADGASAKAKPEAETITRAR